jgi:CTP synthase
MAFRNSMNCDNIDQHLRDVSGLLIPGGIGERGIEGKIAAIRYARENDYAFLVSVWDSNARSSSLSAMSVEWRSQTAPSSTQHSRSSDRLMETQVDVTQKGGTMRLGQYRCVIKPDTFLHAAYKTGQCRTPSPPL